jgi:hypothetical protein
MHGQDNRVIPGEETNSSSLCAFGTRSPGVRIDLRSAVVALEAQEAKTAYDPWFYATVRRPSVISCKAAAIYYFLQRRDGTRRVYLSNSQRRRCICTCAGMGDWRRLAIKQRRLKRSAIAESRRVLLVMNRVREDKLDEVAGVYHIHRR